MSPESEKPRVWKVDPSNEAEIAALKQVALKAMKAKNALYGENPELLRLAIESRFARALIWGEVWTAELKSLCLIVYPPQKRSMLSVPEGAVKAMLDLGDLYNKELEKHRPGWIVPANLSNEDRVTMAEWASFPLSSLLATDPANEGQGLAAVVAAGVLASLQKEYRGISLNTDTPELVAVYARRGGFKEVYRQRLVDDKGIVEQVSMTKMF